MIVMPLSPNAFNISATMPEGPDAFPGFIIFMASETISAVIRIGGPETGLAGDRLSLF